MVGQRRLMRDLKFRRADSNTFGCGLYGGCFVISMIVFLISARYLTSFPNFGFRTSNRVVPPDTQVEGSIGSQSPDRVMQSETQQPLCDIKEQGGDVCDIKGHIRIHGNSSSVWFLSSSNRKLVEGKESLKIKPHTRKMPRVSEVTVKSLRMQEDAPRCMINNTIPAIIFSLGGFMGNFFHDFTDVLIPLFITSYRFNGEVQFLISEKLPWWIAKYEEIFKQLSHYEIIDFNQDQVVRCYSHVIVGLKYNKVLSIDPARSDGLTMVDFGQFIRNAYRLERNSAIKLGVDGKKKPKLLLIARKWTRRFDNVDEIIHFAERMGFEAVIAEMQPNYTMANFAQIVNSGDVLLGVHGAGLTNLVFLPTNAVVIQVVPLGGLEPICWVDFGPGAIDTKLHYLQYSISVAESTLVQRYPATDPNYPVLTDPKAIMNRDVRNWTDVYFFEQSVKLDTHRFSFILSQALELLRER